MTYREWQGGYFQLLASLLHEPFVTAWHKFALADETAEQALHILEEDEGMPVKYWLLQRFPMTGEPMWKAMAR